MLSDDLVANDDISELSILSTIEARYLSGHIYSSIGPIIIAVNPYERIENLYAENVLRSYLDAATGMLESEQVSKLGAHTWKISQTAYDQLRCGEINQAIIVSGESGAGKTETTKTCLTFLSSIGIDKDQILIDDIESRVICTNPLLEGFGNAKTSRNNNSSRFGKWLNIDFGYDKSKQNLRLVGAHITEYLLEKSRVVAQAAEERNFHIFYQLCAHPSMDMEPSEKFKYLNQSGITMIDGIDDAKDFEETLKSFEALKFSGSQRHFILSVLKAILHLGNLEFEIVNEVTVLKEGCDDLINAISAWLGLQQISLRVSLTSKTISVNSIITVIPLDVPQAIDARNAFSKELYCRIFRKVVEQANRSLEPTSVTKSRGTSSKTSKLSIGILDIFGFEIFAHNSFEQLCINFANEKLQQYFLCHVIKHEQDIYDKEGVSFNRVLPLDNEDLLDLMECKPQGLFCRLDEEVKLPKGSDSNFLRRVEADHNNNNNKNDSQHRFQKNVKMRISDFEIRHFAGVVRYNVTGFVEKNRDKLHEHLEVLLQSCGIPDLKDLIAMVDNKDGEGGESKNHVTSSSTIASSFQCQLQQLMIILQKSEAHFIRCIKPNNSKQPKLIDTELVLQQLRYSGVLEAIQVRKLGYSVRRSHIDFRQSYWALSKIKTDILNSCENDRAKCCMIIDNLKSYFDDIEIDMQVGSSTVFFRPELLNIFEKERLLIGTKAVIFIQSRVRMVNSILKFAVLSDARNQIVEIMRLGEQRHQCNTRVMNSLASMITYCTSKLGMQCYITQRAQALVNRLKIVKTLVDKISQGLQAQKSQEVADIVIQYESSKRMLDEAHSLDIDAPEVATLAELVLDLSEKSAALKTLRSSIDSCDVDCIIKNLEFVERLANRYGEFCSLDQVKAHAIHNALLLEFECFGDLLIHVENCQLLIARTISITTSDRTIDESACVDALKASISVMEPIIDTLMSPRIVTHGMHSQMIVAFQFILSVHQLWSERMWGNMSKILGGFQKSEISLSCILTTCPEKLQPQCKQLIEFLHMELVFARQFVEVFWLLTTIDNILHVGCVSFDDLADKLGAFLGTIREFPWQSNIMVELIAYLDDLIMVVGLVSNHHWHLVLSSLEIIKEYSFPTVHNTIYSVLSGAASATQASLHHKVRIIQEETLINCHVMHNQVIKTSKDLFTKCSQMSMSHFCYDIVKLSLLNGELQEVQGELSGKQPSKTVSVSLEYLEEQMNILVGFKLSLVWWNEFDEFEKIVIAFKLLKQLRIMGQTMKCVEIVKEFSTGAYKPLLTLEFTNQTLPNYPNWSDLIELMQDEAKMIVDFARQSGLRQFILDQFRKSTIKGSMIHLLPGEEFDVTVDHGILSAELQVVVDAMIHLSEIRQSILSSAVSMDQKFIQMHLIEDTAIALPTLFSSELIAETQLLKAHFEHESCVAGIFAGFHRVLPVSYLTPTAVEDPVNSNLYPGLKLNNTVLETTALAMGIKKAKLFLDNYRAISLTNLQDLVDAASLLVRIRDAVKAGQWTSAAVALEEINSRGFLESVPIISHEINAAKDPVENFVTISVCNVALSSGYAVGELGQLNGDNVNLEALGDAIDKCERAIANESTLIEPCLHAVSVILKLRQAQKNRDWSEIEAALKEAAGYSLIGTNCTEELARATTEMEIHDCVVQYQYAFKEECIRCKDCKIVSAGTSIDLLVRATGKANSISESKRGKPLIALMALGDIVLKCRKAVVQHQLNMLQSFASLWDSELDTFEITMENIDSVNRKKHSMMARQSVANVRPSIINTRARTMSRTNTLGSFAEEDEDEDESGDSVSVTSSGESSPRMLRSISFAANSSQRSSVLGGSSSTSAVTHRDSISSNSFSLCSQYEEMIEQQKQELACVHQHFAVNDLEFDTTKALQDHGVTTELVGSINYGHIKTTAIESVLNRKSELANKYGGTFSVDFQQLMASAELVLKIRKAVVANTWDIIPGLLELTVTGGSNAYLPISCRNELLCVRNEVENRWVVTRITKAVQESAVGGVIGELLLSNLTSSCERLSACIDACSAMKGPRTEESLTWLRTAMTMLPLRQLLSGLLVNWHNVKLQAQQLIEKHQIRKNILDESVLPELSLLVNSADDRILCEAMQNALSHGGATGDPGSMSLADVSTAELESVCQLVNGTDGPMTDKAHSLAGTCRLILAMRAALLKTQTQSSTSVALTNKYDLQSAVDAWKIVRDIVSKLFVERQRNSKDVGLMLCHHEVMLVSRDSRINDVREQIETSVRNASILYGNLSSMSVRQLNGRSSIIGHLDVNLSVEDLEHVIEIIKGIEFDNTILRGYLQCAMTLRKLRGAVIQCEWSLLRPMIEDAALVQSLDIIPITRKELTLVNREYYNKSGIAILQDALFSSNPLLSANEKLVQVMNAIETVEKYETSSLATQQLLECAKYVYLMRRAVISQDADGLSNALKWFKTNSHRCPAAVQEEAQRALVKFQNDDLLNQITAALAVGSARGIRGSVEFGNVDNDQLKKLLKQAGDVPEKSEKLKEIMTSAQLISDLRSAQISMDWGVMTSIVESLTAAASIHPLIVDEISTARAEINNEMTVRALGDALQTFPDDSSMSLDLTLRSTRLMLSDGSDAMSSTAAADSKLLKRSAQSKQFNYANKNSVEIDLNSIDIATLDNSLETARHHGAYSPESRRLYYTVTLIRSLRAAMKADDWVRIEALLKEANVDENIGDKLDFLAERELQVFQSQLEMRRAIIDLVQALGVGKPTCQFGLVSESEISVSSLQIAIDRADESIADLRASADCSRLVGSSTKKRTASGSNNQKSVGSQQFKMSSVIAAASAAAPTLIQRQVINLIESARTIVDIRGLISQGLYEQAGRRASEALTQVVHKTVRDELQSYSQEIAKSLDLLKVCKNLRVAKDSRSIEQLDSTITTALEHQGDFNHDMGVLRALEEAQLTLSQLQRMRTVLQSATIEVNEQRIKQIISEGRRCEIQDASLEKAVERLQLIREFQSFVDVVRIQCGGIVNTKAACQKIVEAAQGKQLSQHPLVQRAISHMRMKDTAFACAVLAEGIQKSNKYIVGIETIAIKDNYLMHSQVIKQFTLDNYPNLRKTSDFAMRIVQSSLASNDAMLSCSSNGLPTSLTILPPILAAIAVWIFSQCVLVIERSKNSYPEVQLKKLLVLGRSCPLMRDEILLQIMKQLQGNTNEVFVDRLWRCLAACLLYFPPSRVLENYLEVFIKSQPSTVEGSPSLFGVVMAQCRLHLHESIFMYGYDVKIVEDNIDLSLRTIKMWLAESYSCSIWTTGRSSVASIHAKRALLLSSTQSPVSAATGPNGEHITPSLIPCTQLDWRARLHFIAELSRSANKSTALKMPLGGAALLQHEHLTEKDISNIFLHAQSKSWIKQHHDVGILAGLIIGTPMSHVCAQLRNLSADDKLFSLVCGDNESGDPVDDAGSTWRRQWLVNNMPIPTATLPLVDGGDDVMDRDQIQAAVKMFFSIIVDKLTVEVTTNNPTMYWNNKSTKPSTSEGVNWVLFRDIILAGATLCLRTNRFSDHNNLAGSEVDDDDQDLRDYVMFS